MENIGDTPMIETPQPHRLQSVWSLAGCGKREGVGKRGVETAVMIRGQAHRKTVKCHRLNPLSLIQGKRKEPRASNGHQRCTPPPGGEQRDPMARSVTALLTYKLKRRGRARCPGVGSGSREQ